MNRHHGTARARLIGTLVLALATLAWSSARTHAGPSAHAGSPVTCADVVGAEAPSPAATAQGAPAPAAPAPSAPANPPAQPAPGTSAAQPPANAGATPSPGSDHAHHRFDDTDKYVKMFEDPARAEYQKPQEVVTALHLEPGAVVADLGAGSGYFTFLLAKAVGPTGEVFAVDIEVGMLTYIKERIKQEKATNVLTVLAEPSEAHLPHATIDLVFICDTWHHIDDRIDYLKGLRFALKKGARIAIVDYAKRPLPVGPPLDAKIAREDVIKEFQKAGFELAEEHTFLPYQYFLVFKASSR